MKECSKSIARRLADSRFARRYFVGHGVDIGGKPDPLSLYQEFFPLMHSVMVWDWEDGDAQLMAGIADQHFDFVHSSHCLEHLVDPHTGLANWMRVLKPGGHLVITLPDEDLYEQGHFPSTFNRDHKWTFTAYKPRSWSERSVNVVDLVARLGPQAELVKLELLDSTFRFELPRYDQTLTPVGECGIELIIRRRTDAELALGGRRVAAGAQPSEQLRLHLNQYRDDLATLKSTNLDRPPFGNDKPL
jgi:SAM-dependent methyltransferase